MITQPMSVIIVAGGIGSRMESSIPKQFLMLRGRSIARYCFDLFLSLPYTAEIVVVCDPQYQSFFSTAQSKIPVVFAPPGTRRQDSVFNGFQLISRQDSLVCIHDSCRPMLTALIVERVAEAAQTHGSATAGMPVKATIKVCDKDELVIDTPNRASLWEVQTPQIIRYDLLKEGLTNAYKKNLAVTDDATLIELLGYPVKMVEGAYTNLKITTPEDLIITDQILCSNINSL